MGWIEDRMQVTEQRVEYLKRLIDALTQQIQNAFQTARMAFQQPATTSGGSGGMFYCAPSGSIAAASGVPGTGTPGGPVTANVYRITGGAYVLATASASIYNAMLSATTASRVLAVSDNGDGTYTAISQSCT
jgi:hypothetical protein